MNQISKNAKAPNKLAILTAKQGKTFITPNNKEYIFDFEKRNNKYIFIIEYKGKRMQVSEKDFNTTNIDVLIKAIENEI
jgi:hypothetical protein